MPVYSLILVGALLGMAPMAVWAQQDDNPYGPEEGDQELTISGTGTSDTEFDNNRMGLSATYGMYFQDRLKFSLKQQLNVTDLTDDSAWTGSTRVAADYHFDVGRWWPYVGLHGGFIYGDGVKDTMIAGPDAGVKYYVKNKTFVYWETEYQFLFTSTNEAEDVIDDGSWVHTVGVGFNF
ncbi:hypothetical protein [Thiohalorhabdus methylotrophus]|uniref:Outer membrane protein beta-barrel domain-containing protein n=1 Tax=Thiohalorhabdus methylotrophus TaxID=3242694 RepID=A0ABV4TRG7_9GAMM